MLMFIEEKAKIKMETILTPQEVPASEQLAVPGLQVPKTGAELVSFLHDRLPVEQRERLQQAGENFDATMQSLAQPPALEVVQRKRDDYTKGREKAYDTIYSPLSSGIPSVNEEPSKDISLGNPTKREKLFPQADPSTIRQSVSDQLDIRPSTFTMGKSTFEAPGTSEQSKNFVLDEIGRGTAKGIQETVVTQVRGKVGSHVQVERNKPVDADKQVLDSFDQSTNRVANELGEALATTFTLLNETFPANVQRSKLARFVTRKSGHENSDQHGKVNELLSRLEQMLAGSGERRNLGVDHQIKETIKTEITAVKAEAQRIIEEESARYKARIIDIPKDKALLDYAIQVLKQKHYDAKPKVQEGTETHASNQRTTSSERVLTQDERVQADAIKRVEKLRSVGMSNKHIKAAFAQYVANGLANGADLQKYANAYLAIPQEDRENGTTTKQ